MIDQKIFIVSADPNAKGGVSSVIQAIIKSDFYGPRTKFFHPYKDGNKLSKTLNACIVWGVFFFSCVLSKPDYVHIHSSSRNSFRRKSFFMLVCRWLRIQYILQLHSGDFVSFFHEASNNWQTSITHFMYDAKVVVAVSSRSKNELIKEFSLQDCRVIPNFSASIPEVFLTQQAASEKFSSPILSFMGDIADYKGFEDAVKVVKTARLIFPHLTLACAGKMNKQYFDKILNKHKAQDFVQYNGYITGDEKICFLGKALFLLSPSYSETFGMSNLEAASVGTPVLAYDVGGVSSVVTSGKSGYLAALGCWKDLANYLCEATKNESIYFAFQKSTAHDIKSKFSVDKIENLYQNLYK